MEKVKVRIFEDLRKFINRISAFDQKFIILSNYFISKKDPVRDIYQNANDFDYIKNWYNSVQRFNIPSVIFHDGLEFDFIKKYENETIIFIHCKLGTYSLNDERFFVFKEFILDLPDDFFVLTTDINDVVINKNPYPFLAENCNKLFIGRGNRKFWKNGIWTLNSLMQFHLKFNKSMPVSFLSYPVFNPGTIGGKKYVILKLFNQMTEIFDSLSDSGNYDMPVFNYLIKEKYYPIFSFWDGKVPFSLAWNYCYFRYKLRRKFEFRYHKEKYDIVSHQESVVENELIYAGFPFVSMFTWYENPSDAYLIHK